MKPVKTETCNIVGVADDAADLPACKYEGVVYTYWKPDAQEVVDIIGR